MTETNNYSTLLEPTNRDTKIKIVSYVVKIPSDKPDQKWIIKTFEDEIILIARYIAFTTAIEARDKAETYKKIQVILKYTETDSEGKCKVKNHKILTGWRMGTHKILPSLANEATLLLAANIKFSKMVCSNENVDYLCVDQLFNTIYYFTF
jgi:hypothetical protein